MENVTDHLEDNEAAGLQTEEPGWTPDEPSQPIPENTRPHAQTSEEDQDT